MTRPLGSADAAGAADVGADRRWRCDRDKHVRTARDDLPHHSDQRIPALREPERVMAAGAGTGARYHSGRQRPGLDPDTHQQAGLTNAILPLDRTSPAGLDDPKDERR